jgi:structural maintenance of chromosome 1
VESIASKNPKELTGLLEQISGSDDLKRDYEKYEVEKGIAEEKAAIVYQKKRTIVAERKQKKEQKEEAEKHIRLQNELVCFSKTFFFWFDKCTYACCCIYIRSCCCCVYPAELFQLFRVG